VFALVLIVTAALLTLGPEFVYLRDVFTHRLNTVFKFYYAAWILFGIASAYAAVLLSTRLHVSTRIFFVALLILFIAAGLVYPVIGIATGSIGMTCRDPNLSVTLDGTDYIRRCNPTDYEGVLWLQENGRPGDVVLEAVGGQYSEYARVSMATGIPTVLGWPGHEHQWRGELYGELAGSRERCSRDLQYAQYAACKGAAGSLRRYLRVCWLAGTEPRLCDPAGLEKFDRFLPVVFESEGVTIYRADQPLVEEENTP
jgi:uncharacterized membrane protein